MDRKFTKQDIEDDINNIGKPMVDKIFEILEYFSPSYWWIENPNSSSMKNYINKPYYIVDYCKYSNWGFKKPTRIWTNIKKFDPKRCKRDCNNIVLNKKIHKKGLEYVGNGNNRLERYKIPPKLINDLLDCLNINI
jgi:hypothetical protein